MSRKKIGVYWYKIVQQLRTRKCRGCIYVSILLLLTAECVWASECARPLVPLLFPQLTVDVYVP